MSDQRHAEFLDLLRDTAKLNAGGVAGTIALLSMDRPVPPLVLAGGGCFLFGILIVVWAFYANKLLRTDEDHGITSIKLASHVGLSGMMFVFGLVAVSIAVVAQNWTPA